MHPTAPIRSEDRILMIDVLRGFALLGILLMNILSFSMPGVAEANPNVMGGTAGPNWWAWFLQIVIFDGKMRAIFSMLFGAGVVLLTSRESPDTADIYYRRNLWLMLFGMIHAYFLWIGDILYYYALAALMLYPLRKLSARTLIGVGLLLIAIMSGMGIYEASQMPALRDKAVAAQKLEKGGAKLTDEQKKDKDQWENRNKEWQPEPEKIAKEVEAYRGNYAANFKKRAETVGEWHSGPYYSPGSWDVLSFLLLGMGLFKAGVLTGDRSVGFYAKLLAVGYGLGLTLNAVLAWRMAAANWEIFTSWYAFGFYQLGRVLVAFGHVALLVLVVKSGRMAWCIRRLAAVGQTAFSNYILDTLICTTIFYGGYGFGWFGKLDRHQLYYIVAAIWTVQLIVSPIWLRHYRFGPLEWAWRSLTYWERQPFRISAPPLPEVELSVPTADGESPREHTPPNSENE